MKTNDLDDTVGDLDDIEVGQRPEQALSTKANPIAMTDKQIGLTSDQVKKALEVYGPNEIPVPSVPLYMLFLRQFVGFLPLLIEAAAIISLAVQDYVDFGIIAGILWINALLGFREECHAKKSLDEVSNSVVSEITVRRNGRTVQLPTEQLVPGDIILLVGGTVVPADTMWLSGDTMGIDTAALTGEPVPRKYPSMEYGDLILSGTTVVTGECYGQVMATGINTEIGQAQADVLKDKSVHAVSVFQTKVMMVVQLLVSFCLAIVVAVLLVDGLVYKKFQESTRQTILNALSILIASIPVALPLVLQVNLALGASFMAKEHNAIVTSIPALQDIASMSMLCSDKTGTLTTANMSIIPSRTYAADGYTQDDVLLYASLCSNADKKDDPIDSAILRAFDENKANERVQGFKQTEIIGFNPTVKRVVAFVQNGEEELTIAKGLPAKILDTSAGGVDDHELQWKVSKFQDKGFVQNVTQIDKDLGAAGYKTIAIAVCKGNARELDNPQWEFVGLLPMLDPPRHDTAATIASLHYANVSVKMITGDHANVGKETARLIGLGANIHAGEDIRNAPTQEKQSLIWHVDGFASVLPSDKREVVMTLRNELGVVTGMTGDGVNDAPALSAAQVGIAVHGATDAAKNAADLILTEPGLSPIYGAILESRRIFARIKAYVIYRVAASAILALSLSTIIFTTGCAVDSLLVIVLALLNDISMIPVAYDNATASTKPQLPRAGKLVLQAAYYGLIHTGLALLFIFTMNLKNMMEVDLNSQCDSKSRGFIWFYLVMVTELTIFSVRAPSFFWKSLPSVWLILSVITTCVIGGVIAVYTSGLTIESMGYIVLFNLGAFFLVDIFKVPFRHLINEDAGEQITSDTLINPSSDEGESEARKFVQKQLRYQVHKESRMDAEEFDHSIELRHSSVLDRFFLGGQLHPGFVTRKLHGRSVLHSTRMPRSSRQSKW